MAGQQKTTEDYENEVRSWGFSHVFTWTDGSYVALKCTTAFHAGLVRDGETGTDSTANKERTL